MVVVRFLQKDGGGLGGDGVVRERSGLLLEKELDVLEERIAGLEGMDGEQSVPAPTLRCSQSRSRDEGTGDSLWPQVACSMNQAVCLLVQHADTT